MQRIRDVIRDIDTPSWLSSVPYNFGSVTAGKLKTDKWRTLTTVHFSISLISLWGDGSTHESDQLGERLCRVLDHTMLLVGAVTIACFHVMIPNRQLVYQDYITWWLRDIESIHRSVIERRVNGHMAIHIGRFLQLFGPVWSWWTMPFERLIGQLQRIPHNHMFGQCRLYSSCVHWTDRHWQVNWNLQCSTCSHVWPICNDGYQERIVPLSSRSARLSLKNHSQELVQILTTISMTLLRLPWSKHLQSWKMSFRTFQSLSVLDSTMTMSSFQEWAHT